MSHGLIHIQEALRLPELCRQVCLRAGLPLSPMPAAKEQFVLRCGAEPPGLFGELLEEAFVEDEAEILIWPADEPPNYRTLPPGHIAVRPGFDSPCPAAEDLSRAVSPGGRVLLFAVERRDAEGRLLGLTWAAMPEEEPAPQAAFRAAILCLDAAGQPRDAARLKGGNEMSEVPRVLEQIVFARRYTVGLLNGIDPSEWFRMPAEGVTHVAWQVGHLAFAEYRLVLERVRGPRPDDAELISKDFLLLFGRESVPDSDPSKYPSPAEIRAVFDRVHERVLRDLQDYPEAELDAPLLTPLRLARTKREVLLWCSQHEFLHAGQIGLLRRLLGHPPQW